MHTHVQTQETGRRMPYPHGTCPFPPLAPCSLVEHIPCAVQVLVRERAALGGQISRLAALVIPAGLQMATFLALNMSPGEAGKRAASQTVPGLNPSSLP